jgi:hypothetical protein
MIERAVFCEDETRWYKQGDDPWTVRPVPKDSVLQPVFSVVADTYSEAFELLFGHKEEFPAQARHIHKEAV